MVTTGSLNELLQERLYRERAFHSEQSLTNPAKSLKKERLGIAADLKELGRSDDLDGILQSEKVFLENDLIHYGNSKAMRGSLELALNEHGAAVRLAAQVRDPAVYQAVDRSYSLEKNRISGVPRDEARQYFRSQSARLLNMDKSRLEKEEKKIVDERRRNLRVAEKAYAQLQERALGIEPTKSRHKGLER